MSITYLEAIREAQARALRENPNVYIYGQDISTYGGAFKATKNLAKEFPGRVLDSPISEDAMVGSAIGASLEGMRPIVEMQFADFSANGFNQIVNHAGAYFYRSGVSLPITIRLPNGGNPGAGPFHSQSLESLYAHFPGLIIMTPATVDDAYNFLLEAIALDDPVLYCEHKYLYNRVKAERLPEEVSFSAGKALCRRPGKDLTVVTYAATLYDALAAATELEKEGIDIEVIDLRTVKPLDTETILQSVARTGHLLTVSEGWPWGGINAEVIARVASKGFHLLDSPPQRLNCRDTPIPFHPDLWLAHKPSATSIVKKVRQMLDW
jgi:acetoin:2,6-dichlorophenolindophenol oxidoreductase subunit beta